SSCYDITFLITKLNDHETIQLPSLTCPFHVSFSFMVMVHVTIPKWWALSFSLLTSIWFWLTFWREANSTIHYTMDPQYIEYIVQERRPSTLSINAESCHLSSLLLAISHPLCIHY